jgi:hypothetical protein
MKSTDKRLPPKAAELFQGIHLAHRNGGSNPVTSERRNWFEFLRAAHAGNNLRLTGGELYVLLTEEYGWRNDLAQSLAAEYDFAMEFMDFLAPQDY